MNSSLLRKDDRFKQVDAANDKIRAKSDSWCELYKQERIKTRVQQQNVHKEGVRSLELQTRFEEEVEARKSETARGDDYKEKLKQAEKIIADQAKSKNNAEREACRARSSLRLMVNKVNEAEFKARDAQRKTVDLFRSISVEKFNQNTESAQLVKKLIDKAEQNEIIDEGDCIDLFKFFKINGEEQSVPRVAFAPLPPRMVIDDEELVLEGAEELRQEASQQSEWTTQETFTEGLELNDEDEDAELVFTTKN